MIEYIARCSMYQMDLTDLKEKIDEKIEQQFHSLSKKEVSAFARMWKWNMCGNLFLMIVGPLLLFAISLAEWIFDDSNFGWAVCCLPVLGLYILTHFCVIFAPKRKIGKWQYIYTARRYMEEGRRVNLGFPFAVYKTSFQVYRPLVREVQDTILEECNAQLPAEEQEIIGRYKKKWTIYLLLACLPFVAVIILTCIFWKCNGYVLFFMGLIILMLSLAIVEVRIRAANRGVYLTVRSRVRKYLRKGNKE